jgi:hypothetical protein
VNVQLATQVESMDGTSPQKHGLGTARKLIALQTVTRTSPTACAILDTFEVTMLPIAPSVGRDQIGSKHARPFHAPTTHIEWREVNVHVALATKVQFRSTWAPQSS